MGTLSGIKTEQTMYLERHSGSEGKVKKVLGNIRGLESQGLHLGFLVDPVFSRVAEAVFETASFGCRSPY
jgi:hypothetical protein